MTTAEQIQLMGRMGKKGYLGIEPSQMLIDYDEPPEIPRRTKKPKKPIEQYELYVALVFDPKTGTIHKRSSPNLKYCRDDILEKAAVRFTREVNNLSRSNLAVQCSNHEDMMSPMKATQNQSMQDQHGRPSKRPKFGNSSGVCNPEQRQRGKASRSGQGNADRKSLVSYRADATADWAKWFDSAFRAVQQVSCRIIAKEWIKTIHPKKQSTNPYNGKSAANSNRDEPDSELTKPSYWPQDVIHKEPDHINKEARTKLLVHIIMNTPQQEFSVTGHPNAEREITAVDLKESLDKKSDELRAKWHIIEQIILVRSRLEMFEEGGLDASAVICAPDYSDGGRASKLEEESEDQADDTDYVKPPEQSYERVKDPESTESGSSSRKQSTSSSKTLSLDGSPGYRSSQTRHEQAPNFPQRGTGRSPPQDENAMSVDSARPPTQSAYHTDYQSNLPRYQMDGQRPAYQQQLSPDHERSLSSHHLQLYSPREIPPDHLRAMQNQHWTVPNVEMSGSFTSDTMMSQTHMNMMHHSQGVPTTYFPPQIMPQPRYGSLPMQQMEHFSDGSHQQVDLPYRPGQYDSYVVHSPQDQGAMHPSFYQM